MLSRNLEEPLISCRIPFYFEEISSGNSYDPYSQSLFGSNLGMHVSCNFSQNYAVQQLCDLDTYMGKCFQSYIEQINVYLDICLRTDIHHPANITTSP